MNDSHDPLLTGIKKEVEKFETIYRWLESHMPPSFFEEVEIENILLITHSLVSFHLHDFFSKIQTKQVSFAFCLDSHDADLKILSQHINSAIKNYRSYVSNEHFPGVNANLRIAVISFSSLLTHEYEEILTQAQKQEAFEQLRIEHPTITFEKLESLMRQLNSKFLRALTFERLVLALDMLFRAQDRDNCQYRIRYNEDREEKKETPSLQIVFAWRNVPKSCFLYRLAKMIHRHNLAIKRVNAIYIDPYSQQNILLMSIGLHGISGSPAWEETDMEDFLREFATLKYFQGLELIESTFVDTRLISGNLGNLLKSAVYFIHQSLVTCEPNAYSFDKVLESVCRHPDLIVLLTQAFEEKFHPNKQSLENYQLTKERFLSSVDQLDTGNEQNDAIRKNVLKQALYFIDFTLKTNFYRKNKTAYSFRLDPSYLNHLPCDRKDKYPVLPYGIYFMKGFCFLGFHIRFKNLARGGLRTVTPDKKEKMISERNNVFSECYNLALTQQKKNKDIPEGGAKGVIFLEPFADISNEIDLFRRELEDQKVEESEIRLKLEEFISSQKIEHLHQSQRAFVESFITLLNCDPSGNLKPGHIVDYLQKPEYIYLGPDENMHNSMLEWIANYSIHYGYRAGHAFISSKPRLGINHKEFGVTSYGLHICMIEVLKYLGIQPSHQIFTVKMSGGPDGDVAGNQMMNLIKFYPKTARLLSTIDISGTIFDPSGLDLKELEKLFLAQKPIRHYPPEKLSEGGFLLDLQTKRQQSTYTHQTLCWKKLDGKLVEQWMSGNEMNYLLKTTVHQTKADVFIPAGGRPRTLNESNIKDFLDESGMPTSKAIIEGANLYLSPGARKFLEGLGTLIIKDSSSNKGGVICSSFEVLSSLCLTPEEFLKEKKHLVDEILQIIGLKARLEAELMLETHQKSGAPLSELSDKISEKINLYTYEILDFLENYSLPEDPQDPLNQIVLNYCPPTLRTRYPERVFKKIPDLHKKAIISCHIASRVIYKKGLDWAPKITDILPILSKDESITSY